MAVALTGSSQPVSLGGGYALRAPGLRGTADLRQPGAVQALRSGGPAAAPPPGLAALDVALAASNVTEVRQVDLSLQPPPPGPAAPAATLRSAQGEPALELQVPDLGPATGQLVLSIDDAGALRWHLPLDDAQQVESSTTRGAGGVKRFRIPASVARPAPAGTGPASRSLFGTVARHLLKVLVYPITDPLLGPVGEFFAERWETVKRPYGLRSFTPQDFRSAEGTPLTTNDLAAMAGAGRALLFIHGTFSNAHEAFMRLPDTRFAALHQRYGGRVFAFNHFSMSHDPQTNVRWLLDRLPPGRFELDIVCHSRGGLVARALAERPSPFGLATDALDVRRIAFVGVPNQGTVLADPDHMVDMIDRLTSALALLPDGPVTDILEALVTALKVIGHAGLKALPGLASMRPDGDFLGALNRPDSTSQAEYYGIASDYEPADKGLRALAWGAADAAVDLIFEQAGNDLVVPTEGVAAANGHGGFPLPAPRRLLLPRADGVMHTTLFGHPAVSDALLRWLA